MKKISKNVGDTYKIAEEFLNKLRPMKNGATIIGLFGDLGAGKTTFTQAIGKTLKIKRKVNSPTFVIMKKYLFPLPRGSAQGTRGSKLKTPPNSPLVRGGKNFKYLFHLDAYRLKNEKELLYLGWDEIIRNKENLVFIEWPENIIKSIPKKHHQIHISHTKEGHRKIKIKMIK